jgi:hypothetical protein
LSTEPEERSGDGPQRPDTSRSPGTPPRTQDIHFSPAGTGFAVFTAIAIPVIVLGYTRPAGPNGAIIAIGIVLGLLAGLIAGLWVGSRGGRVWRGPQL